MAAHQKAVVRAIAEPDFPTDGIGKCLKIHNGNAAACGFRADISESVPGAYFAPVAVEPGYCKTLHGLRRVAQINNTHSCAGTDQGPLPTVVVYIMDTARQGQGRIRQVPDGLQVVARRQCLLGKTPALKNPERHKSAEIMELDIVFLKRNFILR